MRSLSIPLAFLLLMCAAQATHGEPQEGSSSSSEAPAVATAGEQAINSKVLPAFHTLADEFAPQAVWGAATVEEHNAWKGRFQPVMVELLGRMPERIPLEVRWVEKKEFETLVRHKVYILTHENYWMPAYYFVPKTRRAKTPAIICLHGHSGIYPYIREGDAETLEKAKRAACDYAVYMAEHGYITLAPVVRGWNETMGDPDIGRPIRSCRRVTMDAFLLGMTPMGLRCWDSMRAIDFLETQPEVDSERIGVAGLSGGGALSLYLPVLEPRVKLVMIAGAFTSYSTSIFSIGHCICNCLPEIMLWGDMADVVALYAPRPVLLINGVQDPIFPIAEAREGYKKLKGVYAVLGAPDNIDADFFEGGHAWSNNKTLPFLEKHFGKP